MSAANGQTTESGAPKLRLRQYIAWLWRYWRPHKHVLVFLAFFTLVSTAVAVAYPLVLGAVVDHVARMLESADLSRELRTVMLVLAAILVGRFVARLYPAARAMVNARLERDIRDGVFAELMKKDHNFGNRFRTGDVVTRLTDDIAEWPKIAWFACSGIFRAVESVSRLAFCLAAMIVLSGRLTAMSVAPLPVMMWIFYGLRHRMRYYMEESQKSVSKTNDLLESAFTGIRIVKAFGAEEAQRRRLHEILKERVRALVGLITVESVMFSLDTFASRVGQVIVIAYGGYLVLAGDISIGNLFTFYIYLDMLTGPMMDVPFLFMTGQQAFVSIDRVEEIRSFPVTERRPEGPPLDTIEEIAFERVSFSYDGSRKSLDDVTFRVPAGSRVALVGPVASGKSTVLKLVAGMMSPQEGRILVNGRPLSQWDWDSFRARIGYVPQEALLFSKSIEENVLFGRRPPGGDGEASAESWARHCLSVAQMDADLKTLPKGIETVVGQRGALVSGGQKQRVAIARALAGSPEVLLLDDCTAALDARNEDRFWTHLDEEFPRRTCLIVSHRLSTIMRADRILVLDEGRLVAQGTHDELVGTCRTYDEFLQSERRKAHLRLVGGERDAGGPGSD